jgi:uroporphyrinogen III methyltransferase/synthase
MKSSGIVYLVGAGPGDAGLLTLRGAELLGRAEVVVYDALVNPALLRLAPRTAKVIYGGKRSRQHAIPQEDLNQLLVNKAREGKVVVRLKGGDPYVFGRGGEEAEELADAGVPFEVVPGISSTVAAPNYAGIPITHRDFCASYQVITGHEDPTKPESTLDWAQIAKTPGTKVVLMGVERIREIASELVQHGMPATTPVAMVRWGTTGRQSSIEGTLANIADVVAEKQFTAPAVTIIGGVVSLRKRLNWFENRSFFGQRVVVTRTREQASQLTRQLQERGADVLEIPTIKIAPPSDFTPLIEAISGIGAYSWIIFTSPNGVNAFFEYFFKAYDDIRCMGMLRIAAVGPATAARLKELHLRVDAMPEEYVASKVAGAIAKVDELENLRILCMRAQVANPDLIVQLELKGAIVDDVACYQTVTETEDRNGAAARLAEEGADWVTFTSASTVEQFHARFDLPKLRAQFPGMKTLTIGPETSKALTALGITPDLEAKPHTIEGIVTTLEKHLAPKGRGSKR